MFSQSKFYALLAQLESEIKYWESVQLSEQNLVEPVPQAELDVIAAKISNKYRLKGAVQNFCDGMANVAKRDITLPKRLLQARVEHFRSRSLDLDDCFMRGLCEEVPVLETWFECLQAEFIVDWTTFIIELMFPATGADGRSRSGRLRPRDKSGVAGDVASALPGSTPPLAVASAPEPQPDPISILTDTMRYRELETHGEGLFLGWTRQTLDANADEFLKQKVEQGKYTPGRNSFYYSIGYEGEGHCLTVAPTGSGKGVGVIIPNLLFYKGSTIVIDPKGENYQVTARFRRELGQRVVLLDPFNEIGLDEGKLDRGSLNPFDFMSKDPYQAEEEAQMIAELLCSTSGSTHDDRFFESSAKGLLAGLVHNLATSAVIPPDRRHFGTLIDQIYNQTLWGDRDDDLRIRILDQPLSSFARMQFGNALAAGITTKNIRQFVTSHLSPLSGQNVIESMRVSSLSVEEVVKDDRNGFTIYLVIPPAKLASHAKLLALWISSLMGAIATRKEPVKRRTLFLLDECAQLGRLPQLRSAVTLLRGYGLQTWMFFQDLSQMELLYPIDHRTIVNNCAVLQTFGHTKPSAVATLAEIMAGCEPEDLKALSHDQQMLSVGGSTSILCHRGNYRTDGAFEGRFNHNPRFPKTTSTPL